MQAFFEDLTAQQRCIFADHPRANAALAAGKKSEARMMAEWRHFPPHLGRNSGSLICGSTAPFDGEQVSIWSFDALARRIKVVRRSGEVLALGPENLSEASPSDRPESLEAVDAAMDSFHSIILRRDCEEKDRDCALAELKSSKKAGERVVAECCASTLKEGKDVWISHCWKHPDINNEGGCVTSFQAAECQLLISHDLKL